MNPLAEILGLLKIEFNIRWSNVNVSATRKAATDIKTIFAQTFSRIWE